MAKKLIRVLKQTSHPLGLPCTGCHQKIYEEEPYTEETLPSEQKRAYCMCCKPIANLGKIGQKRDRDIVVRL